VPICVLVWAILLRCKCSRVALHLNIRTVKDYTVLSIVLFFFLIYPLICRITFSNVKCPYVGGEAQYLMSDLEEPCFTGRHLHYVLGITLPQFLLYVLGLPLSAFLFLRNKTQEQMLDGSFRMRFGLLFQGYRPERKWWEVCIAFRKLALVAVGSFGTMWGAIDLQAFAALLLVFISLVVHLVGKPFDTSDAGGLLLHNLEFASLTICWITFWGGLLYFLGSSALDGTGVPDSILILVTIFLVASNIFFLLYASSVYVREYINDRKLWRKRKETRRRSMLAGGASTAVIPVDRAKMAWQGEGEPPPPPPPLEGEGEGQKGCVCRLDCCGFL
jgi:hypothetical protein